MKYLRKFATEAEVDIDVSPNVVLVAESGAVKYNVPMYKNGVYIQHIDGKLYTNDNWSAKGFTNDEANGVAVIADECSFVIAKEILPNTYKYGGYNAPTLTNIAYPSTKEDAVLDLDGFGNTTKLIEQLKDYTDTNGITGVPIAEACANYAFPNGEKGYLPSVGELVIMGRYHSEVNSALSQIGGTTFYSANYATSTQNTNATFWAFWWGTKQPSQASKISGFSSRPFTLLTL